MPRTRLYENKHDGAPILAVRVHPDVLEWIRTVKGYGWARAYLEAAYTAETGLEVPFPNKTRRERNERPGGQQEEQHGEE